MGTAIVPIQLGLILLRGPEFSEALLTIPPNRYEDQTRKTIYEYSASHSNPIMEAEVFVGTILGKDGGIPNKHAREQSMGMKDAFDRDMAFIVDAIQKGLGERDDTVDEHDALPRSIACFWVSVNDKCGTVEARPRRDLESFRYVAASVCLAELDKYLG